MSLADDPNLDDLANAVRRALVEAHARGSQVALRETNRKLIAAIDRVPVRSAPAEPILSREVNNRYRQDDQTAARLAWAHGPERAKSIMAGTDEPTNRDIAAWRVLGQRDGATA